MIKRTFQHGTVTVVGIAATEKSPMYVGISKYGANSGEKYSSDTGLKIAANRAIVKPFTVLRNTSEEAFNVVCQTILGHLGCQKTVSFTNLKHRRNRRDFELT